LSLNHEYNSSKYGATDDVHTAKMAQRQQVTLSTQNGALLSLTSAQYCNHSCANSDGTQLVKLLIRYHNVSATKIPQSYTFLGE